MKNISNHNERRFIVIKSGTWLISFIILIGLTITGVTCSDNDNSPSGPSIDRSLTDEIPYDQLGQGKIVFERSGYLYIIDIDEQSWSFIDGGFGTPVISPDGQKIAYTAGSGDEADPFPDVHIMNIDGTNTQNISFIPGIDRTPSWTPNSKQVLFSVIWYPAFPNVSLFKHSPERNLRDPVLIKEFLMLGPESSVSVSSNNELVFIKAEFTKGFHIFTMSLDGSNLVQITQKNASEYFYSPVWSPNGDKIAYLSVLGDSTTNLIQSQEVVLVDADGSNRRSLVIFEIHDNLSPGLHYTKEMSLSWSPDGSKIAFSRPDGFRTFHIYAFDLNGNSLIQVTSMEGAYDTNVSWSK